MASVTCDLRFSSTFKLVRKIQYRLDLVGVDFFNNWVKFCLIGFWKHNKSERCAWRVLFEDPVVVFYDSIYQFILVSHGFQLLVCMILFIQREFIVESLKIKFFVIVVFVIWIMMMRLSNRWSGSRTLWIRIRISGSPTLWIRIRISGSHALWIRIRLSVSSSLWIGIGISGSPALWIRIRLSVSSALWIGIRLPGSPAWWIGILLSGSPDLWIRYGLTKCWIGRMRSNYNWRLGIHKLIRLIERYRGHWHK